MRVAIVTPYKDEPWETLWAAHSSVLLQSHSDTRHIMVADGNPQSFVDEWDCDHYKLPACHDDYGATPRVVGALSAFARGYDVVGFLDADCWLETDHVEQQVALLQSSSADAVVATRYIMSQRDEIMYVDNLESNGETAVDTNCWFFNRNALPYLDAWFVDPNERLRNDTHFFAAMKAAGLEFVRNTAPTVYYKTRWAFHYQTAGWAIPDDAVWMMQDQTNRLFLQKHIDK